MTDTNTSGNGKKVVDIHMHIGGKGNSTKCYMSPKFLLSPAYFYMVLRSGISLKKLHKDHDKALRDVMIKRLNKAPSVDYGVFLAHDAVYDASGNIDSANSHMITPNEYVMEIAQLNKKVLFGASVHPNRGKDNGIKEIDRCIKGGAVLMKWIPNSHIIDPSDEKYEWFYEKLAAEGIPLLCHTGPEHAVPVPNDDYQELGNPLKLKLPLEKGVTVIAAHCSTAYFPGEKSYLPELKQMIDEAQKPENKWNLYADISAMCSLFRISIIKEVLNTIPHERMVMGSDYPVPIDNLPPYIIETLDFKESLKIFKIKNPIEKNYQQLLAMGFPYEAMTRGWDIIRKEKSV